MSIILGVFEEGLVYAIMALGVYITYKILDFPDLSVDGTFPLGGAVTVTLILAGVNPVLTLFAAFAAGVLAGCVTGFIHVKLKVRDLLSGIIVMTALYSVNLRVAGKSNVPIFNSDSIFENEFVSRIFPAGISNFTVVIILAVIVILVKLLLDLYLKTRSGYLLRAVGDNDTLAALVSCLVSADLFKRVGFVKSTTAVVIGSIIYKGCVSLAIYMGMEASDLKLITAALFLVILVLSNGREKKVKSHA